MFSYIEFQTFCDVIDLFINMNLEFYYRYERFTKPFNDFLINVDFIKY